MSNVWTWISYYLFIASLILCLWYITAGESVCETGTYCNNEDNWRAALTPASTSTSTLFQLLNLCGCVLRVGLSSTSPLLLQLHSDSQPLLYLYLCIIEHFWFEQVSHQVYVKKMQNDTKLYIIKIMHNCLSLQLLYLNKYCLCFCCFELLTRRLNVIWIWTEGKDHRLQT